MYNLGLYLRQRIVHKVFTTKRFSNNHHHCLLTVPILLSSGSRTLRVTGDSTSSLLYTYFVSQPLGSPGQRTGMSTQTRVMTDTKPLTFSCKFFFNEGTTRLPCLWVICKSRSFLESVRDHSGEVECPFFGLQTTYVPWMGSSVVLSLSLFPKRLTAQRDDESEILWSDGGVIYLCTSPPERGRREGLRLGFGVAPSRPPSNVDSNSSKRPCQGSRSIKTSGVVWHTL